MPGFTTHYLFGYRNLLSMEDSAVKRIITHNQTVYNLGLQGPDIFFYDPLSYLPHRKNPGSVAHRGRSQQFFETLLMYRDQLFLRQERDIADAYILGAIGHYALDKNCHPYIYARTHYTKEQKGYLGRHIFLEVDIDSKLLMETLKLLPSQFSATKTIHLRPQQLSVVSSLLSLTYRTVYETTPLSPQRVRFAIGAMQKGTWCLHDNSGFRKYTLRKIEQFIPGYPLISPMIASDTLQFYRDPYNLLHKSWRNPWAKNMCSTSSFPQLMELAQKEYTEYLKLYREIVGTQNKKSRPLLDAMGDFSYHSGLRYGTFTE